MENTGKKVKDVIYIALGIGALVGLYKVAQKFGIFQTSEEKQSDDVTKKASGSATKIDKNNPFLSFNPNYFITIGKAVAKQFKVNFKFQTQNIDLISLTEQIKTSYGWFHDDNEKLYSVFRTIQTQFQLSAIAFYFQKVYKKDMLEFMKSFLNESEMKKIYDIVANYPLLIKQ